MYNFDEIIDRRNTNALNTDGFRGYIFHAGPEKVYPYKDEEFGRMGVADMEFGVAPEILDEMRKRIDRAPENTPDEVLELWHQQLDSAWFELNNLYDDYETETE